MLLLLGFLVSVASPQALDGGVRVVYDFAGDPKGNCEVELTRDSVRFLSGYVFGESPIGERGIAESAKRRTFGRRALTAGERDSAQVLMALASRWKGYRRFVCKGGEGYAFSLWSDSLLLNCDNCFSCTEGISLSEARVLARFGKLSLWLYGLREAWGREGRPSVPP